MFSKLPDAGIWTCVGQELYSNQALLIQDFRHASTFLSCRFDVVFEDSKSGEEMVRTHTGRTRRLYGEPAQTEASFATGADEATGGIADSAFSSVQDGRDGRLLAVNDWESNRTEPRRSKSKQSG